VIQIEFAIGDVDQSLAAHLDGDGDENSAVPSASAEDESADLADGPAGEKGGFTPGLASMLTLSQNKEEHEEEGAALVRAASKPAGSGDSAECAKEDPAKSKKRPLIQELT